MIVAQLLGGLGNQLFQYSLGRVLAEKNGTRLKLDISAIAENRFRPYALQPFCIQADVLTDDEAKRLGINKERNSFLEGARAFMRRRHIQIVVEPSFDFDPAVLNVHAPCYLKGYWQSPKYFEAIEPLIRSELQVATPLRGHNIAIAREIASNESVALHVRRGDYANNPQTRQYHGTCDPEYYYAAERLVRSRVGQLRLFVFSDDPQWARENLHFSSSATIVDNNLPDQGHEDLRLMAMCRHHIIANSTFSWWGAWLSENRDKTVIAPKAWFAGAGQGTKDLIPNAWIRM